MHTLVTENSTLVHGHPEGPQAYWYPNGNPERKFTLLKNWRHEGPDSAWYESGELEYSGFWTNNQMDGFRIHWDKLGNKIEVTTVANGKTTIQKFGKVKGNTK